MRKDFGKKTWMYPMPVLIIGTYDESGIPNAMNAAWGGIYDTNQIMLCLSHDHKTTENIKLKKEFTVSFANAAHVSECDYFGIASGNTVKNKLDRTGFHVSKSNIIDAPLFDELPMALECKLVKFNEDGIVIADILNISIDDSILDENGKVDTKKASFISFDSVNNSYVTLGDVVGKAFSEGKKYM